jgi:GNAT superfamily N-acetyltransferase
MEKQNELSLEKLENENLGGLIETYKECFGIDVDEDYFKWKYYKNPCGEAVCFIALDGRKVGAFYGVIPEIYEINGKKIKVYQSMDTMTHPNYQRRGLFTKLANLTYQHILDNEGKLILTGIPGGNSYPGFVKKLGWKDIHQFSFVFLHKTIFKLKKLLAKREKINIKSVSSLTEDTTLYLQNRPKSEKPIRPFLSAEFFEWRVFKNPNKKKYRDYKVLEIYDTNNQIIGICVYILDDKNRCYLEFLEFNKSEDYINSISPLMEYLFATHHTDFVYSWDPQDVFLRTGFKKAGFIKNPFNKGPFSYKVPIIIRSEPAQYENLDWYDIENFNIQPLMQD